MAVICAMPRRAGRTGTTKRAFSTWCSALGTLGVWARLHYVYPYPHVDNVLPLLDSQAVLPYLDIPFQHASASVLKRMRRPAHAVNTLRRIERWRQVRPELALRSTFIVGFPGETEAEFEELLTWLDAAQIDRVGCFTYSAVQGAAANELAAPVAEEVKQERFERFMLKAGEISAAAVAGSDRTALPGADRCRGRRCGNRTQLCRGPRD